MPPLLSIPLILLISLLHLLTLTSADSSTLKSPSPTPTPRLIFVAELCRHGDRAPLYQFPSDALPVSKWPEGIGELTAIGQRAHFQLGQRLRARYVDTDFLPQAYHPKHIYVRSTDSDRTLTSAVSQMAGLYPPGSAPNTDVRVRFGKDPLHENEGGLPHLYQPVPIHTTSTTTDMMLLTGANCPRHDYIMRQRQSSNQFKDKIAAERPFLDTAATIAGVNKNNFTIFDLERLSDTWTCFAAHSVPLPDAATPDVVSRARNISNWLTTFGNQGLEVHRLRAGLILHEITLRFAAAALRQMNKLPPIALPLAKKFVLLSAHDVTLAATLSALQVFDGVNPPYNSTIIWELFQAANNSFMVRIEYNGRPIHLPGCSNEYCMLQDYFKSTIARTVPGEAARFIECLIGWRRYAALATNVFRRRNREMDLLGIPVDQGDSGNDSGGGFFVIGVIALISAVVAIVAVLKVRARYKGYLPTTNSESLLSECPTRTNMNSVSDRPILM